MATAVCPTGPLEQELQPIGVVCLGESGECLIFMFLEALLWSSGHQSAETEGRAAAEVVFSQHNKCEIEPSRTGSAAETPPNPVLNSLSLLRTQWKLRICSPEKCVNIDTHPAMGIRGTQATHLWTTG